MKPPTPPPPDSAHDFASEHADPTSKPITPSPTGPLEGFDPDHGHWGVEQHPPLWQQLKRWWQHATRR